MLFTNFDISLYTGISCHALLLEENIIFSKTIQYFVRRLSDPKDGMQNDLGLSS